MSLAPLLCSQRKNIFSLTESKDFSLSVIAGSAVKLNTKGILKPSAISMHLCWLLVTFHIYASTMFMKKATVLLILGGTYPTEIFPLHIYHIWLLNFRAVKNFSFRLDPNIFWNMKSANWIYAMSTTFVYSKLAVKTISFPHCGSRLSHFHNRESFAAERYCADNALAKPQN